MTSQRDQTYRAYRRVRAVRWLRVIGEMLDRVRTHELVGIGLDVRDVELAHEVQAKLAELIAAIKATPR